MKPNCTDCTSYKPVPPEEIWQGYPVGTCEHLKKKIWDVTSRNCEGLFYGPNIPAADALMGIFGYTRVDAGDNGQRYTCNDCGVQHG